MADVPSPNKEMIEDLNKLGIFDGGEIDLLEPITRGEYITLLFKANNAIRPPGNNIRLVPNYNAGFTDIDSSHPAYKYVQALANAGYSVGYDDKSLQPDRPLTREELIGIKVGVDANEKPDSEHNVWNFSDYEQIDRRFKPYVYNDNFLQGDNGTNIQRAFGKINTFKPKQPVA